MSIKKWLEDEKVGEERKRREEKYNKLSEKEQTELKKKKIIQIVQKEKKEANSKSEFLNEVLKFNEWLNQRKYIKGDIDKIETWIRNLYKKLASDIDNVQNDMELKKAYNQIPANFLDEKTRIALNKKLRKVSRTSSDNYFLRKLNNTIKERLKEAEYYEILRKLLE